MSSNRPNRLRITSDYGTLKNDSGAVTISVTVPNGLVFNHSNPILGSASISIGTINAPIRAVSHNSKTGVWSLGSFVYGEILSQMGTFPVQNVMLMASLYRESPTTMRLLVSTEGFNGAPNSTIRETQTITFKFSTFLSPDT